LATTLSIGVAEERPGINVQLGDTSFASVNGRVVSAEGGSARLQAKVEIYDTATTLQRPVAYGTYSDATNGTFRLPLLPPGQYRILASTKEDASSPEPWLWGVTDVSVGGRTVNDVTVMMQRGSSLSGRVVLDSRLNPAEAPLVAGLSPLDRGRRLFA